jgi:hypothetical protein
MRRCTLGALLFTFALLVGAAPVWAQIEAKISLPFAFQVEETVFSAGTYQFSQANPNADFTIRGRKINGSFMTTPLPAESAFEKEKTWLVFRRYGDKYFLAEIWSRHIGREFRLSAAEKKLRDGGQQPTPVRVNVKL